MQYSKRMVASNAMALTSPGNIGACFNSSNWWSFLKHPFIYVIPTALFFCKNYFTWNFIIVWWKSQSSYFINFIISNSLFLPVLQFSEPITWGTSDYHCFLFTNPGNLVLNWSQCFASTSPLVDFHLSF